MTTPSAAIIFVTRHTDRNYNFKVEVVTGDLGIDLTTRAKYLRTGGIEYDIKSDTYTFLEGDSIHELMDSIVPAIEANPDQPFMDSDLVAYLRQNTDDDYEGLKDLDSIATIEAEQADDLITLNQSKLRKIKDYRTLLEKDLALKLGRTNRHMEEMRATLGSYVQIHEMMYGEEKDV